MKVLRLALFVACAVALAVGYGLSQLAWFQGRFEEYALIADSPLPRFISDVVLILFIAAPIFHGKSAAEKRVEADQ